MWEVNEKLIEEAKQVALEMVRANETIRSVPFAGKNDVLFVTTNPGQVCGTDSFTIGEKTFFLGWKT